MLKWRYFLSVIPMYVGVIPPVTDTTAQAVGDPHVCGGNPYDQSDSDSIIQCSPYTWGKVP